MKDKEFIKLVKTVKGVVEIVEEILEILREDERAKNKKRALKINYNYIDITKKLMEIFPSIDLDNIDFDELFLNLEEQGFLTLTNRTS